MKHYLEQFISALNKEDIHRLQKMDIRDSKIKSYLTILINNRHNALIPKEEITPKVEVLEA